MMNQKAEYTDHADTWKLNIHFCQMAKITLAYLEKNMINAAITVQYAVWLWKNKFCNLNVLCFGMICLKSMRLNDKCKK